MALPLRPAPQRWEGLEGCFAPSAADPGRPQALDGIELGGCPWTAAGLQHWQQEADGVSSGSGDSDTNDRTTEATSALGTVTAHDPAVPDAHGDVALLDADAHGAAPRLGVGSATSELPHGVASASRCDAAFDTAWGMGTAGVFPADYPGVGAGGPRNDVASCAGPRNGGVEPLDLADVSSPSASLLDETDSSVDVWLGELSWPEDSTIDQAIEEGSTAGDDDETAAFWHPHPSDAYCKPYRARVIVFGASPCAPRPCSPAAPPAARFTDTPRTPRPGSVDLPSFLPSDLGVPADWQGATSASASDLPTAFRTPHISVPSCSPALHRIDPAPRFQAGTDALAPSPWEGPPSRPPEIATPAESTSLGATTRAPWSVSSSAAAAPVEVTSPSDVLVEMLASSDSVIEAQVDLRTRLGVGVPWAGEPSPSPREKPTRQTRLPGARGGAAKVTAGAAARFAQGGSSGRRRAVRGSSASPASPSGPARSEARTRRPGPLAEGRAGSGSTPAHLLAAIAGLMPSITSGPTSAAPSRAAAGRAARPGHGLDLPRGTPVTSGSLFGGPSHAAVKWSEAADPRLGVAPSSPSSPTALEHTRLARPRDDPQWPALADLALAPSAGPATLSVFQPHQIFVASAPTIHIAGTGRPLR